MFKFNRIADFKQFKYVVMWRWYFNVFLSCMIEYFGLQYSNKNYQLRWVDLEKPLKKQLEKYTQDPVLKFGVMLYAPNMQSLKQEITRYLFFLQLKSDIIEGLLPCSLAQAILLASFAVQAEFGDYGQQRQEKFTINDLQEYVLLPRNMTTDLESQAGIIQEVLNVYVQHSGMTTEQAEFAYISEVSQLDGYGQESYPAKDDNGQDLFLGCLFTGLFVRHINGQSPVYFNWDKIANLSYNRRIFGIEMLNKDSSAQFQMDDAETAKYVWRMCKLQQQFQKYNLDREKGREIALDPILDHQRFLPERSSIERKRTLIRHSELKEQNLQNGTTREVSSEESLTQHMTTNGDYSSSQLSLENQHNNADHYHHPDNVLDRRTPDVIDGSMVIQTNGIYNAPSYSSSINYSNPRDLSPAASRQSLVNSDIIQTNLRTALPEYRQTPDYETAMRQRRDRPTLPGITDLNQNVSTLGYGQVESGLYPQSHVRNGPPPSEQKLRYRLSYNGPGPAVGSGMSGYHDTSVESLQHALLNRNVTHMVHTISVPELSSNNFSTTQEYIAAKVLKEQFRPPPPYPRGSTSTPDLAHQSLKSYLMSSSSPDLVGRKMRAHFEPLQEVVNTSGGVHMNNAMSTSANGDLSQSLPMEAFENLRIQERPPLEIQHGYNVYPNAVPNVVPMYNPTVPHPPANLRFTFTEPAGQGDMPMLSAPAGYEDRGGTHSPKGNRDFSPSVLYSPMPLVSPPSEFADTSDLDSTNMSPTSMGSPPHQYRLPTAGVTYPREIQVQVMQANTAGYGSPSQVSPEMREFNMYSRHAMEGRNSPLDARPYIDKETAFTGADMPVTVGYVPRKLSSDSPTHPTNNTAHIYSQANRNSAISDSDPSSISEHPSPTSKNPDSSHYPLPEESKRDSLGAQATSGYGTSGESDQELTRDEENPELSKVEGITGPLKVAAMSGLTMMRPEEDKSDGEEESRHPRDARRKILEEQLREGRVFTEYQQIPKKLVGVVFHSARLPDNQTRNRFIDVLPYEDNRVTIAPMHENSTGYINASHISMPIAKDKIHYIAAQAPMQNTVKDWWRMIWEQGVQVIAMLTKIEESGKEKCFKYWPNCGHVNNTAEFGPFRIIGQFSNDSGSYTTSGLTVRHIPSGEQRTVWHLQYNHWPDKGVPDDIRSFLTFLEEFQTVCRHAEGLNEDKERAPPLIHCCAGVGRTGVLILADVMVNSLERNEEINIPKMLENLDNRGC
ncbi:putative tyrosine-protein phosphatase non-receptor type 21 [Apostichopus japonicus]|uniref:protein-tyrosine-phosphatase n=1 Tax=Stichopus japonicus TaxID=307972 RepID=A0A2G8KC89_STIJA|nr:putative tyrosine-protein phosphatase non-receptor type 21 [Apostichopus japonicus]